MDRTEYKFFAWSSGGGPTDIDYGVEGWPHYELRQSVWYRSKSGFESPKVTLDGFNMPKNWLILNTKEG